MPAPATSSNAPTRPADPAPGWLAAPVAPASLFGLALLLRLLGLDRRAVWFDEAVTWANAHVAWPGFLGAVRSDVHPPLSYFLYHLWPGVDAGELWLRLPSVVLGALAVPVAWAWTRRLAGPPVAFGTALLLAVAPLQVDLAQEARMYGLVLLLTAASLSVLDRVLTGAGRAWVAGYALVGGLLLLTHYYGAFLLAAQGATLLALLARRLARPARSSPGAESDDPRPVVHALLGLAGAGMLFLPWLPTLLGQVADVREGYWIDPPRLATLWTTFRGLAAHTQAAALLDGPLPVAYALAGAVLLVGVVSAVRTPRQWPAVATLLVAPGLALLVSLLVTPVYTLRYVSPAGIGFAFLLARGAQSLPAGWPRAAAWLVVLFPAVTSLPPLYLDPGYARADLRAAAAYVMAERVPGEPVLHLADFTALPFDYYRVPPPRRVLYTDERAELCNALANAPGAWLVTAYTPDDEAARATAEQGIAAPTYAGSLVRAAPARFLGVSVFHLAAPCPEPVSGQ